MAFLDDILQAEHAAEETVEKERHISQQSIVDAQAKQQEVLSAWREHLTQTQRETIKKQEAQFHAQGEAIVQEGHQAVSTLQSRSTQHQGQAVEVILSSFDA